MLTIETAAGGDEPRNEGAQDQERPLHVDREHAIPVFFGRGEHGADRSDGGVVANGSQLPARLLDPALELGDVGGAADVSLVHLDVERPAPRLLVGRLDVARIEPDAAHDEAALGERHRDLAADAVARSGDDRDPHRRIHHPTRRLTLRDDISRS
jgi:hypothetical protein